MTQNQRCQELYKTKFLLSGNEAIALEACEAGV
jgi:hypothetical protein